MPLGRVIAETVADLRDRVEVSWHHDRWQVTASSFEAALNYVETRFDDAAVLSRRDHGHRWPRVTLEVSTDPALATKAPPLIELAHPPESGRNAPACPEAASRTRRARAGGSIGAAGRSRGDLRQSERPAATVTRIARDLTGACRGRN